MKEKSTLKDVANNYLTHTRQNEGITLIALVVTIVVLIILASISVNLVFKEGGLIDKAKQAKDMQINAQEQEDHTLNKIAKTIRKLHTR